MGFDRKRMARLTAAALLLLAVLGSVAAICRKGGMGPEGAETGRGTAEEGAGTGRGTMALDARAAGAADADGAPAENPLEGRDILFSGFEDIYAAPDTPVRLENREENLDFLMRYEIRNAQTGELVFETGLIPSGQYVSWVPGEMLDKGVYELDILQIPCFPDPSGGYLGLSRGSCGITLAVSD